MSSLCLAIFFCLIISTSSFSPVSFSTHSSLPPLPKFQKIRTASEISHALFSPCSSDRLTHFSPTAVASYGSSFGSAYDTPALDSTFSLSNIKYTIYHLITNYELLNIAPYFIVVIGIFLYKYCGLKYVSNFLYKISSKKSEKSSTEGFSSSTYPENSSANSLSSSSVNTPTSNPVSNPSLLNNAPLYVLECERCEQQLRPARGIGLNLLKKPRFRCPRCGEGGSSFFDINSDTDPRAIAKREREEQKRRLLDQDDEEDQPEDEDSSAQD